MTKNINNLKKVLTKEFKISKTKYVTINNTHFIGGEKDLFTGSSLKEIQFILLVSCIADNQLMKEREKMNNFDYTPSCIHLRLSTKTLKSFLGTNKNRNIKSLEHLFSDNRLQYNGIYCSYDKSESEFIVILDTDIFIKKQVKDFTKVYIGDILCTKSIGGLLIKLKSSKFSNITQAIEGFEKIEEDDTITIMISKTEFKNWTDCGEGISKCIRNSFQSINNENENNIKAEFSVENKIIININRLSYFNHVKNNCDRMESEYMLNNFKNKNIKNIGG